MDIERQKHEARKQEAIISLEEALVAIDDAGVYTEELLTDTQRTALYELETSVRTVLDALGRETDLPRQ